MGIAEEDLSKLFEAFEQVGNQKKQSEGTGLGLAISQQIVQLMGGTIQVNSQLGQGSTFFFTVDVPQLGDWTDHQSTDETDGIIGYDGDQRYSILVVDDRWENRAVLFNLLEPLGFDILEAENGQEGLTLLHTQSPDIVITDIAMPVMDGFDFLKTIRSTEALQATKVIVSSASVSQLDQQMAFSHGGNDFLPKPVEAATLFQLLAHHLTLKWVYNSGPVSFIPKDLTSSELVIPERSSLEELLVLAESAKVKALRSRLEDLKSTDSIYTSFADSILRLAQQFQTEEIEDLLKQYLKEDLSFSRQKS